jgi:hypothetical protein
MEIIMNDLLVEKLIEFQQITVGIINMLKQENYDELEAMFNNRQRAIEEIKGISYSQEQFKNISAQLRLVELENVLTKLLDEKKQIARAEMDKVTSAKKANNNYKKNFQQDSLFFNKKI